MSPFYLLKINYHSFGRLFLLLINAALGGVMSLLLCTTAAFSLLGSRIIDQFYK